jgi:hypothetical protein
MADILFVTDEDIKKRTPMGGNVDTDKYLQSIFHVQQGELLCILGEDLYNIIEDLIRQGTIGDAGNEKYNLLVTGVMRDFLVFFAAADYALLANYTIGNGGVSSYQPDNGNPVSTDEILRLTDRLEQKGRMYGQQMLQVLSGNKDVYDGTSYVTLSFPEWEGPCDNSVFFGWETGGSLGCGGTTNYGWDF